jgi:hypothetical protein
MEYSFEVLSATRLSPMRAALHGGRTDSGRSRLPRPNRVHSETCLLRSRNGGVGQLTPDTVGRRCAGSRA